MNRSMKSFALLAVMAVSTPLFSEPAAARVIVGGGVVIGAPYYAYPPYYTYPYYAYPAPQYVVPAPAPVVAPAPAPYCREYNHTVVVGGQPQNVYGTACQQPDGSWKIIN